METISAHNTQRYTASKTILADNKQHFSQGYRSRLIPNFYVFKLVSHSYFHCGS